MSDNDWSLSGAQALWMLQHHNLIEDAFATDNMSALDIVVASDDFKTIFGEMSFDEAYDRYESMLEDGR